MTEEFSVFATNMTRLPDIPKLFMDVQAMLFFSSSLAAMTGLFLGKINLLSENLIMQKVGLRNAMIRFDVSLFDLLEISEPRLRFSRFISTFPPCDIFKQEMILNILSNVHMFVRVVGDYIHRYQMLNRTTTGCLQVLNYAL